MKTVELPDVICTSCGASLRDDDGQPGFGRWRGPYGSDATEGWEHKCPGLHPQCGHFMAVPRYAYKWFRAGVHLEAENVRLRTLLRELVEYWDAAMSDDATPEAVMMMEDAVRRAREEVE